MNKQWQAPEAEKVFIGSILTRPARLLEVTATKASFMIEAHATVFDVIMDMNQSNNLIDLISVADRLTELNASSKITFMLTMLRLLVVGYISYLIGWRRLLLILFSIHRKKL